MIKSYEEFLSLFPEKPRQKAGEGYLVLCPAHNDHAPSLWIRRSDNSDFIATWDCKAGCTREDVLKALNISWADVTCNSHSKHKAGSPSNGNQCRRVDGAPKQAQKSGDNQKSTNAGGTGGGLTLSEIAEAKKLPVDFLKSLGVSDYKRNGLPSIRIPYYSPDGQEIAVRFRIALTGDRFRWRTGDHVAPYGLQTLERIRQMGWALVVEGESDCWTGWYHNLPVLGTPGKGNWLPAWNEYLKNVDVYVYQEPDAEDFVLRILPGIPDLRYIVAPEGMKDISEAHIQGVNLPLWLEELKAKAKYGRELKAREANEQTDAAYKSALCVINSGDPLELVKEAIRASGYGGDIKPVLITYLAATSRLLEMRPASMPVHLLLIGPPAAGKSYTIKQVLAILPPEAFHEIDAGSPRVLIYDNAELKHRVVIFSEADSLPAGEDNPAASAVRNLLQDHHLHYCVTIRDPSTGVYGVYEVDKQGPTVLFSTSIKPLGPQLMTRVFSLEVSDSEVQIKAALDAQAQLEIEGVKKPDTGLIAFQLYLQLKAPFKVIVPFARELAWAIGKTQAAPRILRDFARLMSLIKSVALLRYRNRSVNSNGQILATVEDYSIVRELINDTYIDSSSGITREVRKLVNKVIELNGVRASIGGRITNLTLAKELRTNDKRAKRLAEKATRMAWIVNREQRKGYPADYEPAEPMPDVDGLPLAQDLTTSTPVGAPPSTPNEAETDAVDTSTPVTDGSLGTKEMVGHKSGDWEAEI